MRIPRNHAPSVLLVSLMLLLLAYPVAYELRQTWMRTVLNALFVVVLFTALYAERGGFSWRRPGVYAVFVALILRALTAVIPGRIGDAGYRTLLVVTEVYTALLFMRICISILRTITTKGSITANTIAGASAVYVLLFLGFADLHMAIFLLDPGAYEGLAELSRQGDLPMGKSLLNAWGATFTYYSAVTQTTLGYGDITPKSPTARGLTIFQTVVGQLYIAILLARLVAMELGQRARRDSD